MFTKPSAGNEQLSRIRLVAYLIVIVVLACTVANASAAEIKVGGAIDDCKGYFDVFKDLFREETGINTLVSPSSSAQGLIDLDRGNIDIATTGVPLEKLVTELENNGYPVDPESFQAQGIATNKILVYLNKVNKVTELSQQQLRDIFTGVITNWNQLGGDNLDIVVIWGGEVPETNRLFQQYVIGFKPITKSAVWATHQEDTIKLVVKTPGAIGIASNGYLSAQTRNPKTPFVSSTVFAITKGAPSKDIQKLIEEIKSLDL